MRRDAKVQLVPLGFEKLPPDCVEVPTRFHLRTALHKLTLGVVFCLVAFWALYQLVNTDIGPPAKIDWSKEPLLPSFGLFDRSDLTPFNINSMVLTGTTVPP